MGRADIRAAEVRAASALRDKLAACGAGDVSTSSYPGLTTADNDATNRRAAASPTEPTAAGRLSRGNHPACCGFPKAGDPNGQQRTVTLKFRSPGVRIRGRRRHALCVGCHPTARGRTGKLRLGLAAKRPDAGNSVDLAARSSTAVLPRSTSVRTIAGPRESRSGESVCRTARIGYDDGCSCAISAAGTASCAN
jgi:hypothetical protein